MKDNTISVEVQVEIIRESQRKKNKLKHSPATCSFTPLHWATYHDHYTLFEILLCLIMCLIRKGINVLRMV